MKQVNWRHSDVVKQGRRELVKRKAAGLRQAQQAASTGSAERGWRVALWEAVWPFVLFLAVFGTVLFGLLWLMLRGGI